jgi:SAM-dependent methyltransferase
MAGGVNPFSTIYRENLWNGVESRSGPGSGSAATAYLHDILDTVLHITDAVTVLDVACGDGFWMPDLPGYLGVDIAPEAIRIAKGRHPDRDYEVWDIRELLRSPETTAPYDLVIIRDAIQHMSLADGVDTIAAIRATQSEWLLASTYIGTENVDIRTGLDERGQFTFYTPDLQKPPFSMGPPRALFPDGFAYDESGSVRDERKMLGLWYLWEA